MGFQQDSTGGGGVYAPSFKPRAMNDGFKGEVVAWREEQAKKYKSEEFETLSDGTPLRQYVITVQTHFRDWDRCAKIPLDEDGKEKPASEDDGLRNVYVPNQKSSNFREVAKAVVDAIPDADDLSDAVGGILMGKWVDEVDTGKGNPYRIYEYRFEALRKPKESSFQAAAGGSEDASSGDTADAGPAPQATEAPAEPPF